MKALRSLRFKFALYFAGFVMASMMLLGRSLFEQEHDALLAEMHKRVALQASNLGVQAREALETNDDLALVTTLRGMRSMEDFEFASVLHPDGTVFAHSYVHLVGQTATVPEEALRLADGSVAREVHDDAHQPRIEVWTPVFSSLSGHPERIGFVCVSVSKNPLLAAVDQAKRSAVRVGAWFVALGVLGALLIRRTVTRPIGMLVEGVRRIASGDLGHKMNLRRADEIGMLSDSFDHMTDELQRAQHELLKQQLYEKELEVAAKIQSALLPASAPAIDGFQVAALSVPARMVGGDFFDYIPLRDGKVGFLVADVAGKGVSAGLVMAYARSAARSAFNYTLSPHGALAALNEQLLRDFDRTTFVTMLCLVLDIERRTLSVANAGHPPVLCFHRDGSFESLRMRGVALGIVPRDKFEEIREETTVHLSPGDMVLGFSDGVSEAHDAQGQMFGEDRIQEFGGSHAALAPEEFLARLRSRIEAFAAGGEQFDDITALALKAEPAPVRADKTERTTVRGGV